MEPTIQTGVSGNEPTTQPQVTSTPASPQQPTGASNPTTGDFVPRERLNEVIAERNALRDQVQKREEPINTQQQPSEDATVDYYKKLFNVPDDERIAKIAAEKAAEIAKREIENQQNIQRMDSEAKRLKELYPGDEELPPFDAAKVIEYGQQNGIFNMEAAYRQMNWEKLAVREARKLEAQAPTYTERPASSIPAAPASGEAKSFEDLSLEEMAKILGRSTR